MSDQLIPAEIRKIAEDVQKMEDELFKKPPEEKTPEQLAEEKAAAEKAEAEKKAAEEAAVVELTPEQKAEAERKAAEEKAKKEAEEAEAAKEGTDLEKSEHKYKVLQGKYNKELPRERDARKAVEEKLVSAEYDNSILRKQLLELSDRLEKVEKGDEVKKDPEESQRVTDVLSGMENDPDIVYIKNEFPDVWKGLKKVLNKTYDKSIEGTSSKIAKVEEKIRASEETAAKTSWTTFHKYLDDNVDGWRTVNVDPEFKEWLTKEEKHLGIKDAISEMNGQRVAKFFVDFAKSKEKPVAKPAKDSQEEDKIKEGELAAPKGVRPAPVKRPVNSKDEFITQEDIAAFYERKRRKFYIGREAEMDAEEKKIEKAVVEGRVR